MPIGHGMIELGDTIRDQIMYQGAVGAWIRAKRYWSWNQASLWSGGDQERRPGDFFQGTISNKSMGRRLLRQQRGSTGMEISRLGRCHRQGIHQILDNLEMSLKAREAGRGRSAAPTRQSSEQNLARATGTGDEALSFQILEEYIGPSNHGAALGTGQRSW